MKKYFLLLATIFLTVPAARAVCIPTNEFRKIFLGFSEDGTRYAVGSSDRSITLWGPSAKKEEGLFKNRICTFHAKDGAPEGTCVELASTTEQLENAQSMIRKEFSKTFKSWTAQSPTVRKKKTMFMFLDCEKSSTDQPECEFAFRNLYEDRILDKVWSRQLTLTATAEVTPLIHKTNEIYFSKAKKNVCARFERIAHISANCGSREDIIVCGPGK